MTTPEDLKAVQDATAAMTRVALRLDSLEAQTSERITELRDHFDREHQRLEAQMGTMNAHLDNIVREVSVANDHHGTTNRLLEEDIKDRKEERCRRLKMEAEALEHQRKLKIDEILDERKTREEARLEKREMRDRLLDGGREVWSIMRAPLGYLIAAALGYAAWHLFGAAPAQQLPALPQTQVEAHE